MGRLFGTDGVRGVAGDDLTGRLAMELAVAAVEVLHDTGEFAAARAAGRRPAALVGRDPRASGEFLEAAVVAGLAGSGVDVLRLGVIPTPAVAFLTASLGAELGVVLSASHNPAPDNGIKFFSRGGFKLPDAVEDEIEDRLGKPGPALAVPPAAGFGRVTDGTGERERYLAHLLASIRRPGGGQAPLAGLRVVVDCAHGAASDIAPAALRRAGAEVITIGTEPDGLNINEGCGSTHLSAVSEAVVAHGADAGIAHDGDADRCLAVDASGAVVDGDQILAVLARELADSGQLAGNTVVATVMSNLGFRIAMADAGITMVETAVGDRYLIEAMRAGDYVLGGEQSGHIIMLDHATTGDGILTGLQLLSVLARRGRPLAEVAAIMTRYPQVLINVRGVDKARVSGSADLAAAIAAARAELGDSGRALVRPSGTEPAVRVMVEAVDESRARQVAEGLAAVVRAAG
ncbi:MAG: phosphoglucosamine mutase [Actinobacteria bacterium]|nr:phosphoglucosamine mutase [Actinomycetota bacterium]